MSSGRAAGSAGTAGMGTGMGTGAGTGAGTGTVPGAAVPAPRVVSAPGVLGRGNGSAGEGKEPASVTGALPGPASSGRASPGGLQRAGCLQNRQGWEGPLVIQANPLPKQGHPEQVTQ